MIEIGFLLSMTGVGGRPEVVIEGSNDLDGPWLVWLDYFSTFDQLKNFFTTSFAFFHIFRNITFAINLVIYRDPLR